MKSNRTNIKNSLFLKNAISIIILISLISLSLATNNGSGYSTSCTKKMKKSGGPMSLQTNEPSFINTSESVATTQKCPKKDIFPFGICIGGATLAKKLNTFFKSGIPKDQKLLRELYHNIIRPNIKTLANALYPNGCIGSFSTNFLLKDAAAAAAQCNFPLTKGQRISALGFGLPGGESLCIAFDKCFNFAIDISGQLFADASEMSVALAWLAPFAKVVEYIQFGISPNRNWENSLELMDPLNKMKKKTIKFNSNIYFATKLQIPKIGISFGGEDISKWVNLEIKCQVYLDFGENWDPSAAKKTMHDKKQKHEDKSKKLLQSSAEFSFHARGSLAFLLSDPTEGILPDFTLVNHVDLNMLVNSGSGKSSGMPAGFHVYMKLPELPFSGAFLKDIMGPLNQVLKCFGGKHKFKKFPNLGQTEMGLSFTSTGVHFRFKMGILISFECGVKIVDGKAGFHLSYSCKLGKGIFVTILKTTEKYFSHMGKEFYDTASKDFLSFENSVGNFAKDIDVGAKKFFKDLEKKFEKAWESAKKDVKKFEHLLDAAYDDIKNIKNEMDRDLADAAKEMKEGIDEIGDKLDKGINDIGDKFDAAGDAMKREWEKTWDSDSELKKLKLKREYIAKKKKELIQKKLAAQLKLKKEKIAKDNKIKAKAKKALKLAHEKIQKSKLAKKKSQQKEKIMHLKYLKSVKDSAEI